MVKLIAVVFLFCLGVAHVAKAEQPDAAVMPSIPGVTSTDTHPEACVSCHIRMDDIGVDARLSTALREWESAVPPEIMEIAADVMGSGKDLTGKHPAVGLPLEDVPSSCIRCHEIAPTAPAFGPLIHLAHYRGGEENHFISIFAGACTLCHKLDPRTGAWQIPDGRAD